MELDYQGDFQATRSARKPPFCSQICSDSTPVTKMEILVTGPRLSNGARNAIDHERFHEGIIREDALAVPADGPADSVVFWGGGRQ